MGKNSNHAQAPICAAFVEAMREYFPELKVLYVKEGEFEIGEPVEADHDSH